MTTEEMTTDTDELRKLIEARGKANAPPSCSAELDAHRAFVGLAASWVSDHAPALLTRLERYEAALQNLGWHLDIMAADARAALNDGQEKA